MTRRNYISISIGVSSYSPSLKRNVILLFTIWISKPKIFWVFNHLQWLNCEHKKNSDFAHKTIHSLTSNSRKTTFIIHGCLWTHKFLKCVLKIWDSRRITFTTSMFSINNSNNISIPFDFIFDSIVNFSFSCDTKTH